MSSIPIPACCADRPQIGGRVVPYVSVVMADGRPTLGAVHRSKAMRCISDYLCQVDGLPLDNPIVVLVSDDNLARRYSPEAALHPQCAAYSMKACPVMAGDVRVYREVDRANGTPCSEPGCDCGGWVDADPAAPSSRGKPVGVWWAVWLRHYAIAVNNKHEIHGLAWTPEEVLRVRPVLGTHHVGADIRAQS